jgi:hypothetical protein
MSIEVGDMVYFPLRDWFRVGLLVGYCEVRVFGGYAPGAIVQTSPGRQYRVLLADVQPLG